MDELKYSGQLKNLIENIIKCTQDVLPSLKESTKKCLEPINNLLNTKDIIKEKDKASTEINQGQILSNYFIRQLRLKYQYEINKNISDEIKIISKGKLITEYIFWLIKETKLINFQQSLKFLQDIVETFPLCGLEELFNLISNSLKKIDNNILLNEGKLDVLLIQNMFLKRTNNNLNAKFRGRIRLLFSDLFSITEKSGANLKGYYSQNQINEELSNYSNDNSDTVKNDNSEDMMEIDEKKEDEQNKIRNEIKDNQKDKLNKLDNNINKNEDIHKKEEKMEIEEEEINEVKKVEEKEIKEEKENKLEEINYKEKEKDKEINIRKEENEKMKFYKQFWIIEKILIDPFMVCKKNIIYIIIKIF